MAYGLVMVYPASKNVPHEPRWECFEQEISSLTCGVFVSEPANGSQSKLLAK
jgi:hypothetical protein